MYFYNIKYIRIVIDNLHPPEVRVYYCAGSNPWGSIEEESKMHFDFKKIYSVKVFYSAFIPIIWMLY